MQRIPTPVDLWVNGMKVWQMSVDLQINMAENAMKLAQIYSPKHGLCQNRSDQDDCTQTRRAGRLLRSRRRSRR